MARYFVDRPVFAAVIALLITLAGALALVNLPVAQYPAVAPPQVAFTVTYPGASAKAVEDNVLKVLEQEMNGIEGLLYMESSAELGRGTLTLTFETGTDPELASVEAQNRYRRVEARLPDEVKARGVTVTKPQRNWLMIVAVNAPQGGFSAVDLGSIVAAQILDPIRRVPGVGEAVLFGTEYAMRIWLDPDRLRSFGLTPSAVANAIRAQNVDLALGEIGQLPAVPGQQINAILTAQGKLTTPEAFRQIIVRAEPNGAQVRLGDVAQVELGADSYDVVARLNQAPNAAIGIRTAPGANALEVANAVKARMRELEPFLPPGVQWEVPYDTSRFVEISIREVVKTLVEAVVLVFLVMWLFLGNLRATLIPMVTVPVALAGAAAVLWLLGYSINVLTLFAMVLAIGILVDDAIIVVENVERHLVEEGLSPREATVVAMREISGAVIGVSAALVAVFAPLLFFGGSVGVIYRQFAVTLIATMVFSAFLALSLAPALAATFLRAPKRHQPRAFDRFFFWLRDRFGVATAAIVVRPVRWLLLYGAIVAAAGWLFVKLPTAFLPDEDQGYIIAVVQLPAGATRERTEAVLSEVERFYLAQPEVARVVGVLGFSFFGRGQNTAIAFVPLKHWDERPEASQSAQALVARTYRELAPRLPDALIVAVNPPPIPELGAVGGFDFRLLDRTGTERAGLLDVRNRLLAAAAQDPRLFGVRPEGQEPAPAVRLAIDRERAAVYGIDQQTLNETLAMTLGTAYLGDFLMDGRVRRVQMSAAPSWPAAPETVLQLPIMGQQGQVTTLAAIASAQWETAPPRLDRFNGVPSVKIGGQAAPGVSSGEAMAAIAALARAVLPAGYDFAWATTSYEEQLAGAQAPLLFVVAVVVVYLALAALYESWRTPAAILLVVPFGVLGAASAALWRGLPNDVFFKVGLIVMIGLSAKNAILIAEFARQREAQGQSRLAAVVEAARLRLRPILMTSLTFILAAVPLALSSGAGAASRHAVGTGVVGGMVAATFLAIFWAPLFYRLVASRPASQVVANSAAGAGRP
ncbi:multidrug efflux RND transporter permease subunit [Hydrogenophilus thiooxidans]|uniref:multidrug efflux RND transporter permease subunit n=1 Tax=Hydrogenophilus thiooxidans TaxID=2820326 RepID=UPI002017E140|nr:multidrug efflux RND transporter permease subunit [Hydrogenophilus thiooxidans]